MGTLKEVGNEIDFINTSSTFHICPNYFLRISPIKHQLELVFWAPCPNDAFDIVKEQQDDTKWRIKQIRICDR